MILATSLRKGPSVGPIHGLNGRKEITLGLSQPMASALESLTHEIGTPVKDVLSQAVVLLMVAVEAQKRGQRVCLADDDLKIMGEIVNFGVESEQVGIDPFPEVGSDPLDP